MNDPQPLAMLADIELPSPPGWPWWLIVLAIAVVLLVALLVSLSLPRFLSFPRKRESRSAGKPDPRLSGDDNRIPAHEEALHRLNALRADWLAGRFDDREAAYRLSAVLRIGLGVVQLTDAPPALRDAADWPDVLAELRRVRYRAGPQPLDQAIFDRAATWLRAREPSHA